MSMINTYCNNFWQGEQKENSSDLSYKHKCITSCKGDQVWYLQLLSADVKINSGWFTCIIFVFLKEFRNQILPLEVLSLPAWLTQANAPAIPTRTWAPAIYLLR